MWSGSDGGKILAFALAGRARSARHAGLSRGDAHRPARRRAPHCVRRPLRLDGDGARFTRHRIVGLRPRNADGEGQGARRNERHRVARGVSRARCGRRREGRRRDLRRRLIRERTRRGSTRVVFDAMTPPLGVDRALCRYALRVGVQNRSWLETGLAHAISPRRHRRLDLARRGALVSGPRSRRPRGGWRSSCTGATQFADGLRRRRPLDELEQRLAPLLGSHDDWVSNLRPR